MRVSRIPAETAVDPAGASRHFPGSPVGVLVLHGWTGNALEMTFLASRLAAAGYTVSLPRLPGHGTNGGDFLQTTWQDWLRRAIDAYLDLARECDTVFVAGLSMGGVLATILASIFPIPRLALYAPAIVIKNRLIHLTPVARLFVKRFTVPHDEEEVEPAMRALDREYHRFQWIAPAYHLRKLQRLAAKRLRHVRSDALIVVSQADESVPVSVADVFSRKARAGTVERLELTDSPHVLVNGIDKERVATATVEWFQSSDRISS